MSTVPEIEPTKDQNQQAVATTAAAAADQADNHPTTPANSAATIGTRNLQNPPSIPETAAKEAIATHSDPPQPKISAQPTSPDNPDTTSGQVPEITSEEVASDNSAQPTKPENQETLPSSVPEITQEEAALPTDFPAQTTTEMAGNQQKSDQIETPNQVSAKTPDPQTETPKPDSPEITTKTEKKTDAAFSKKGFPCFPLLQRPKERDLKPNQPALVQPTANVPAKDGIPKKETLPQDNATISRKDELSKSIDADIKYIKEESSKIGKYKDQVSSLVAKAAESFEELKKVGTEKELRELKKEVTKLKLQIPSKHKADAEEKDPHKSQQATGFSRILQKNIPQLVMEQMPQLHKSTLFESSSEVRDFEGLFHGLSVELKLCLLCFSIFPENAIIKKRLMVYWWIAEGFVPPIPRDDETKQQIENGKTAEDFGAEYFEQLTKLGFIEPVNKKRTLSVGCYTMHPFVRFALIMLAEKANFFNFDEEGMPTEKSSGTFQSCLMGRGLLDFQDLQKGRVDLQDLEKLHAVFNVNEPILDFRLEWFLRMKNLNVLYLGRWKVSATDHIEVEENNFLEGLRTMDHLRFFSLQGVSNIMELPDSISQLSNLMILDLRACHNLESIPEGIRFLRNLTYLDISECYLLEHMPKGLAMLSNLKVLKGFVVGEDQGKNTCSLDDLKRLENLIKLCIYTGLGDFPGEKDLNSLQQFKALKKLTIAWGGDALHTQSNKTVEPSKQESGGHKKKEVPKDERKKALVRSQTLRNLKKRISLKGSTATASPLKLEKLEKLDLKSFPKSATPDWLMPSSLKSLKKLYIRGGKFSDLGQYQDLDFHKDTQGPDNDTWKVEILRLKYLSDLEMDWRQLQELFPNLIYLEKVNCPKLSFFPSDGFGVWIDKEKLKQMQVRS